MVDETTRSEINRLADSIRTNSKNITELWSQFNGYKITVNEIVEKAEKRIGEKTDLKIQSASNGLLVRILSGVAAIIVLVESIKAVLA